MTIWVISDTHFGQESLARVFESPEGHPARVDPRTGQRFPSAQAMNELMIERWCDTVKPGDHIYHLGDVCMNKAFLSIIKALPGAKRLILGNHDTHGTNAYREAGFQKVLGSRRIDGLLLTHFPVHERSLPSTLHGNVHGHTHQWNYGRRYLNVCVEQTDYRPISLEECQTRLAKQIEAEPFWRQPGADFP
jgi:calcineurin-like phosphoesterase family protein